LSLYQVEITLDRDWHDNWRIVEKPDVSNTLRSAQLLLRFSFRRCRDGDRREQRGLKCKLGDYRTERADMV
jgi:hypothetical protein